MLSAEEMHDTAQREGFLAVLSYYKAIYVENHHGLFCHTDGEWTDTGFTSVRHSFPHPYRVLSRLELLVLTGTTEEEAKRMRLKVVVD